MKAIACQLPSERGLPLSRFSSSEIAREAVARGIVEQVSGATVWRWLAEDAIRPWNHRSWIFPRDPDFRAKAARVLDLYAGCFEGKLLHPGEFVLCADEKPSIQARARLHQTLPPLPGGDGQLVEHEYERKGALCYLACWDVRRAKLFDRCEPKGGIEPFDRLVDQVMTQQPYASARRVFWIVDNGSSHRGQRSIERLEGRSPNLTLVHLPVPRQLAQPNRDLLLDRPAQAAPAQRLQRPHRRRRTAARIRTPLRASRAAVRMEVHPRRPRPPARTARHAQPHDHARRMTELANGTT